MSKDDVVAPRSSEHRQVRLSDLAADLGLSETTLARVLAALRDQQIGESSDRADRRWLSIAELAAEMGMSEMTLYRVIAAGEFPAVRIGRRLFIPARVLDEMAEAALATGRVVTAAQWCGDQQ